MKDFEISKEGIVVIQWLRPTDPQLGVDLFQKINKKEMERENYFVMIYLVNTKSEFVEALKELINTTEEGTIFTLHIVAHGNEDLIGVDTIDNNISWKELFEYTRQLNVIMGNNLLLVLSSCVGGGVISHIEPEERAPYRAIIANTREVIMKDAHYGFDAFYRDFYNILDFPKGLEALNKAIDFSEELEPGRKKTEFFIMSSEQSFDEVFNPDRDPAHFESVINKIMLPTPDIPQEKRIEKVKELFREHGKKLKPHFNFQD